MVGQEDLINYIKTLTLDTFPKSSILLGEDGSGKHEIVKEISSHLNLPLIEYKDISFETLMEIQLRALPALYLIDTTSLTEKTQNIILKFIEEPLNNSIIILLAENKNLLLDTVVNRCRIFELKPYSKEILKTFVKDTLNEKLILEVCTTPGQIYDLEHVNIKDLYTLCEKIITRVTEATYVNTLSISDKLNYSDEYDKFDVLLFFKILTLVAGNFCINNLNLDDNQNNFYLKLYNIISKFKNRILKDKRLNKEHLVENFLTELWMETHG